MSPTCALYFSNLIPDTVAAILTWATAANNCLDTGTAVISSDKSASISSSDNFLNIASFSSNLETVCCSSATLFCLSRVWLQPKLLASITDLTVNNINNPTNTGQTAHPHLDSTYW